MLNATAAAALRPDPPLSPVLVDGVLVSLLPLAPAFFESVLAWPSWVSPAALGPPSVELPPLFVSAPVTLALAVLEESDDPMAVNDADPTQAMLRLVTAVTSSLASVRASEAPMAALEPLVSPLAVVVTVAAWVAEAV